MLGNRRKIHFVGIGGIGMSGMAELLHKLGFNISGSDLIYSERTNSLNKLGIEIYNGHNAHNITNPDVVVYSSAINQDNPEIYAAKNPTTPAALNPPYQPRTNRATKIPIDQRNGFVSLPSLSNKSTLHL